MKANKNSLFTPEELEEIRLADMEIERECRSNKNNKSNSKKRAAYKADYYLKHRDEILLKSKQRRQNDKEKVLMQQQAYREKNRDKLNKKSMSYYLRNRETILEKQRERRKQRKMEECG